MPRRMRVGLVHALLLFVCIERAHVHQAAGQDRRASKVARGSPQFCCQHKASCAGRVVSLKQIISNRIPQICEKCAKENFGEAVNVTREEFPLVEEGKECTEVPQKRRATSMLVAQVNPVVVGGHGEALQGDEFPSRALDRSWFANVLNAQRYMCELANLCSHLLACDELVDALDVEALQNLTFQPESFELSLSRYISHLRNDAERRASSLHREHAAGPSVSMGPPARNSSLCQVHQEWLKTGMDKSRRKSFLACCWREMKQEARKQLEEEIPNLRGDPSFLPVLFAAHCRRVGLRCRLVFCLHPLQPESSSDPAGAHRCWNEVLLPDMRWIHCDPLTGAINSPDAMDGELHRSSQAPVSYVFAVERQRLVDVTRRYVRRFSQVNAARGRGEAIARDVLDMMRSSSSQEHDVSQLLEEHEFVQQGRQEELPTNPDAYRKHPYFVLEDGLAENEVFRPGKRPAPIGTIAVKDAMKKIYRREDVSTLRTRDEWKKILYSVREGEAPVKMLEDLHNSMLRQTQGGETPLAQLHRLSACELFGEWQVEPFEPGRARDGKVPKNEKGHVELLSPHHLPQGCSYIDLPTAALAARRLKVDHAPALVDKVVRSGRILPIFDGIVVCKEHEAQVRALASSKRLPAVPAKKPEAKVEGQTSEEEAARVLSKLRRIIQTVTDLFHPIDKLDSAVLCSSADLQGNIRKLTREFSSVNEQMRGLKRDGKNDLLLLQDFTNQFNAVDQPKTVTEENTIKNEVKNLFDVIEMVLVAMMQNCEEDSTRSTQVMHIISRSVENLLDVSNDLQMFVNMSTSRGLKSNSL